MSALLNLVPLGLSVALCSALHLVNRRTGWFRIGEMIFWDVILLILVFLVWLRWF